MGSQLRRVVAIYRRLCPHTTLIWTKTTLVNTGKVPTTSQWSLVVSLISMACKSTRCSNGAFAFVMLSMTNGTSVEYILTLTIGTVDAVNRTFRVVHVSLLVFG